ncbi:GDP-D-glucose phosphorylase 1 [Apteryx mantelli]|uniref:GDP-D-glucose phosphorylase 1 n=1 Tax=Apteryx mantelli TaxID=2696672 RepID=A0A8B7J748_9AVES
MAAEADGDQAPPEQPGSPDAPHPEDFVYSEDEFIPHGAGWRSEPDPPSYPLSRFDRALQEGWKHRMELGLFRYHLGELQTRVLPGPMQLVAQLNIQRGVEKRKSQVIHSIRQPFNPQEFNFTQIRPGEVLFRMCRSPAHPPAAGRPQLDYVLVVINVSPLELGHMLLLPEPTLRLPQVLTPELLRFGLDAVLLSAHPGFRVGFNSLGAFASVNHLHLHGFYLNWPLLVESAPAEPLSPAPGLFFLRGVPAPGFLFYSQGEGLDALARDVCRAADRLLDRGVAYNVLVTRGAPPQGPGPGGACPGLRVLLWARRAALGAEAQAAMAVALCELAGHLPLAAAPAFRGLTEAEALRAIRQHLLPEPQLEQLRGDLARLLAG